MESNSNDYRNSKKNSKRYFSKGDSVEENALDNKSTENFNAINKETDYSDDNPIMNPDDFDESEYDGTNKRNDIRTPGL